MLLLAAMPELLLDHVLQPCAPHTCCSQLKAGVEPSAAYRELVAALLQLHGSCAPGGAWLAACTLMISAWQRHRWRLSCQFHGRRNARGRSWAMKWR